MSRKTPLIMVVKTLFFIEKNGENHTYFIKNTNTEEFVREKHN